MHGSAGHQRLRDLGQSNDLGDTIVFVVCNVFFNIKHQMLNNKVYTLELFTCEYLVTVLKVYIWLFVHNSQELLY